MGFTLLWWELWSIMGSQCRSENTENIKAMFIHVCSDNSLPHTLPFMPGDIIIGDNPLKACIFNLHLHHWATFNIKMLVFSCQRTVVSCGHITAVIHFKGYEMGVWFWSVSLVLPLSLMVIYTLLSIQNTPWSAVYFNPYVY